MGRRDQGGREKLGLPGNRGPLAVVTDKGVLRFDEKTKRMYLAGYYPGVTIEDIVENTGFEIDTSRAVQLEAPSEEIIKMIRRYRSRTSIYKSSSGRIREEKINELFNA